MKRKSQNMKRLYVVYFLIIVGSVTLYSSLSLAMTEAPAPLSANDGYWPTSEWRTDIPESEGMNGTLLQELHDAIENPYYYPDLLSLLLVKNGTLVYEQYQDSSMQNASTPRDLYSATKSITSTLIGMALDKGYIDNISQTVLSFFPDYTFDNPSEEKNAMTIEDLLTMRSGLDFTDADFSYTMGLVSACFAGDAIQYVLDHPMKEAAGTTFAYDSGASHILAAILNNTVPDGLMDFANTSLFSKLGISNYMWTLDMQKIPAGFAGLYLTPRDMAKIGFLLLNNGTWDGEQIVSKAWVVESSTPQVYPASTIGYGYQWWIPEYLEEYFPGIYAANGLYTQRIIVCPEDDLVIVITSKADWNTPPLLVNYIYPALTYEPEDNNGSKITGYSPVFLVFALTIPSIFLGKNKLASKSF